MAYQFILFAIEWWCSEVRSVNRYTVVPSGATPLKILNLTGYRIITITGDPLRHGVRFFKTGPLIFKKINFSYSVILSVKTLVRTSTPMKWNCLSIFFIPKVKTFLTLLIKTFWSESESSLMVFLLWICLMEVHVINSYTSKMVVIIIIDALIVFVS